VFPLEAREGGTLVRAGHTEAAVDLARLAGHCPAGVICEIMNDDGTMARVPDLVAFAQRHGLKLGTVADLISYRRRTERLVRRVAESTIEGVTGGSWKLVVYANTIEGVEHLALLKGPVSSARPAAVRMHTMDPVYDLLPDAAGSPLSASMRIVSKYGNGVVVLIRSASTTSLSDRLNAPLHGDALTSDLRDYGIGAQILVDLGVRDMIVLSNHPRTIVGLEGYGLNVVERWPIPEMPTA
jgi:3,4-dihydroxy 2-butanone 4-phosphate synthase/GTP cyclohydrolase II